MSKVTRPGSNQGDGGSVGGAARGTVHSGAATGVAQWAAAGGRRRPSSALAPEGPLPRTRVKAVSQGQGSLRPGGGGGRGPPGRRGESARAKRPPPRPGVPAGGARPGRRVGVEPGRGCRLSVSGRPSLCRLRQAQTLPRYQRRRRRMR
ncbi:translation initiation factor IF-2-like [Schistocerca nitens]|uniref:translation initiation factor IF-2-like n=1 Tax=Schistocerca nitens TaxID=7011 RepID=UPI00211905DD|nr:translation initiation factor IF-2-like [Schistocerca nitens]